MQMEKWFDDVYTRPSKVIYEDETIEEETKKSLWERFLNKIGIEWEKK